MYSSHIVRQPHLSTSVLKVIYSEYSVSVKESTNVAHTRYNHAALYKKSLTSYYPITLHNDLISLLLCTEGSTAE